MKILSEKKVLLVKIKYDNTMDGRAVALDYLDDKYGQTNWGIRRLGPIPTNEHSREGLLIAEVDI